MSKEIRGEKEFDEQLRRLSDLYEEGKNCLHRTYPVGRAVSPDHEKLYGILREMRDMAATQLQRMHWVDQN